MSGERLPPGPVPGLRFATHAENYAWALEQPRPRFERVRGKVYVMAQPNIGQLRRRMAAYRALRAALAAAGVDGEVLPSGITVEVGGCTNYAPSAVVNIGPRMDDGAVAAPCPIIVVEAPWPGQPSVDSAIKLADYFRVPAVRHCLIVRGDARMVVHHRRASECRLETTLHTAGAIALDPPGITLEVDALYDDR